MDGEKASIPCRRIDDSGKQGNPRQYRDEFLSLQHVMQAFLLPGTTEYGAKKDPVLRPGPTRIMSRETITQQALQSSLIQL